MSSLVNTNSSGTTHPFVGASLTEFGPARDTGASLPSISRPMLKAFTFYSRRYLCRHFHTLRISRAGMPPEADGWPLLIYSNHASWWDPLVCLALKEQFYPQRRAYAPIDAAMLQRYTIFKRLGFFGVEQKTVRGARQFLRTAQAVLQSPANILAVTPQGRFADARERPVRFEAGLGHLAARCQRALLVPLATEFVFWEERLPEILVRFGEPTEIRATGRLFRPPREWTGLLEQRMSETLDALAVETQRRRPDDFKTVLRGGAGQGGVYDLWCALRSALRGETFQKEHGDK
jgi:1-acyl-sn-glycerol-3-phosphate acyltransferase